MDDLKNAALSMGITLSQQQLSQFEIYYQELISWNQKINLTRITTRDDVISKHFLDSLSCLLAVPTLPKKVIDVGAGPGLPGLALKIAQPNISLAMVEATGKKVTFLQHLVQSLELTEVTVLHHRAEEVGQQHGHRGRYDLAVARAVAQLPVLAEYLLPLLHTNGLMLAQKGGDPSSEVNEARRAFQILGGQHLKTLPVDVPKLEAVRHLVLVKKVKSTPKTYPRKPGIPAQKPIR